MKTTSRLKRRRSDRLLLATAYVMMGATWIQVPLFFVLSGALSWHCITTAQIIPILWAFGTLVFSLIALVAEWRTPATKMRTALLALVYVMLFAGCIRNIFSAFTVIDLCAPGFVFEGAPFEGILRWYLEL